MTDSSPAWPALLHHIKITSDQPSVLLDFYRRVFDQYVQELSNGQWLAGGGERSFLIGSGAQNRLAFSAFAIDEPARVVAAREWNHGAHTPNLWGVAWMRE